MCYYDDTDQKDWVICDKRGRHLPRGGSPVPERDTFAVYDDARCRGTDLKLNVRARALLTLGPGMTKDRLMQAAGRMRQLSRGQRLHVVGLPDVTDKIKVLCQEQQDVDPGMVDVLQWVVENTVKATSGGILQWAGHGLHYALTKAMPTETRVPEKLALEDLYSNGQEPQAAERVVHSMVSVARSKLCSPQAICHGTVLEKEMEDAFMGTPMAEGGISTTIVFMTGLVQDIDLQATKYSQGFMATVDDHVDQECERELENQEEEEMEKEVEVARAEARKEKDWQYMSVLTARCAKGLTGMTRLPLRDVVRLLDPSSLSNLSWSPNVSVSANFFSATQLDPEVKLNEYQHKVSWILYFPKSNEVMVLSSREADGILCMMYCVAIAKKEPPSGSWRQTSTMGGNAVLMQLCYLTHAMETREVLPLALSASGLSLQHIDMPRPPEVLSLHLFNGGTMFPRECREYLKKMVRGKKEETEALTSLRGTLNLLPHSDLQKAADVMVV